MNNFRPDSVIGASARSDRATSMVAAGIIAYLTITVILMLRHAIVAHDPLPLIAHIAALSIAG